MQPLSQTRSLPGRLFCIPILLFLAITAHGERLPVKTYTTVDGLLRDSASCLVQDSRGFLWLSSSDGLSRFYGYGFTNYTTGYGLPHRVVNDFLETRAGVYWVATNDGLARFNPKGERDASDPLRRTFVSYRPEGPDAVKGIEVLFEDAQGKLWCGTDDGLYWFEEQAGQGVFHRLDLPKIKANSLTTIMAIAEDKRGSLWIGSDGQALYRHWPDGRIESYTDQNGIPIPNITAMLIDLSGRIWVGMSSRGGVCQLVPDPVPNRVVVSRCYSKDDGLADNWIRHIYQSADGTIWVCTTSGITTLNRDTARDESQLHIYKDKQGLCDGEANATVEDRDGNIWVSTTCGIKKITRNGFVRFTQDDGLASLLVNSIIVSPDGTLFVITKAAGKNDKSPAFHTVNRLDNNKFTFATPRLPASAGTGWGGGQIIVQDKAGNWWLPGDKQAVYRFLKPDGLSTLARTKPKAIDIPDSEVFRIYEDSRGDLWISTMPHGRLLRWESVTETMRDHRNEIGGHGTASCFAEDNAGNLWMGFDWGAARLVSYRDRGFRIISTDETEAAGGINSLLFDHAGRLWFTTRVHGVGR